MCKLFKFKQLPPPVSVLGLAIASAIALVSCQKENYPSKFELRTEGFSSGNKMAVNAFTSTWSSGDQVRICNASYTVSVEASRAYVSDVPEDDDYCAVFPASIVAGSISGGTGTVVLPDTYLYEKEGSNQKLPSPMMAYLAGSRHRRHGLYDGSDKLHLHGHPRRRRLLELTEVRLLLPGREYFSRKKRFAASPLCESDGNAGHLPLSVTG